jgi:hypothetical protein
MQISRPNLQVRIAKVPAFPTRPDISIFLFACALSKRDKDPTLARHFYSIFPARAQSIPRLSSADPSTDQTHSRVPRFGYVLGDR